MSSLSGAGFDVTVEYGEAGERYLESIIQGGHKIEVKRKSYLDDRFYVEFEQQPYHSRDGPFKPSGIATTEADLWAYVIGETGVVVVLPTSRLRVAARTAWCDSENRRQTKDDSDNPTRGVMVSLNNILRVTT